MAPLRGRGGKTKTSTTRLPQALKEEIYGTEQPNTHGGRKRKAGSLGRKAERKAERQVVKQRKAQYFATKPGQPSSRKLDDAAPPAKKPRIEQTTNGISDSKTRNISQKVQTKAKDKQSISVKSQSSYEKSSSKKKADELTLSTKKRSHREDEEDAYAAMLEKKLGLDKRKKGKSKYGSGFENDGLLDLLVDLDEKVLGGTVEPSDDDLSVDDDDEEYEIEYQKDIGGLSESDDESQEESQSKGENDDESNADSEDADDGNPELEWEGFGSESGIDASLDEGMRNETAKPSNATETETRYVPPHLRKQFESTDSESNEKLRKLLKGLLNRLSEQNIDSILKEIEGLYRKHMRHDMTTTLTKLIVEGTCSHSTLLDSYVALHAGLIACLHKIIGIELAASFVQSVVITFQKHYADTCAILANADGSAPLPDDLGKECSNLLVLLSELYNYHVISCVLMYDIIRLILEGSLSEQDVELILKLARSSGSQLRQDDPSALKDIIQTVQSKVSSQGNTSSRTRFMVETLNNLKNNKIKRSGASVQDGGESKERIIKFISGIGKRYHVHAHEPLRISLDDLNKADSKGKWWLVGAAWGGDPLLERQRSAAPKEKSAENELLRLAKKQGMNTDVRRSIFVMLMSGDDYVDACDRLAQLSLTEIQQREIIRVLLHCCGNEKSYNPYYALIGSHLCKQGHSQKVTFQYCLWDFLRSIGEANVGGAEMSRSLEEAEDGIELNRVSSSRVANMARIYAWLIAKDSLSLTILKTLDFLSLKTKTRTFLHQFFTHLFVFSQDQSPIPDFSPAILSRRSDQAIASAFLKIKHVTALAQGLLFLLPIIFKESGGEDGEMRGFLEWAYGVARQTLERDDGVF